MDGALTSALGPAGAGRGLRSSPQLASKIAPRLATFDPSEAVADEYVKTKGHELPPHIEHRLLGGAIVVALTLLSDAKMTFEHTPNNKSTGKTRRVKLPRRSLYILSADARYDWTHAIKNEDIFGERHLSITMRDVKFTFGSC